MTWFPKEQRIPPGSNLAVPHETAVLCTAALDSEERSAIQMDDFTFIIPTGIDSSDRFENLSDVLLYIMTNTTAKVKIVWSETESNLEHNALFNRLRAIAERTSSGSLVNYFRENSSAESFTNLVSHEAAQSSSPATAWVFGLLSQSIVGRHFRAGTSGSWQESLEAVGSDPNPFATGVYQRFFKECVDRVELSLVTRSKDEPFDRTKYINLALSTVDTEFVCNHDVDVLLTRSSLMNTVYQLKKTNIDFVYPYAHETTCKSQVRVFRTPDVNQKITLACLTGDFTPLLMARSNISWPAAYGQSIFARTESYKSAGGENEDFRSWGAEDVERYVRFVKLGYTVGRVSSGYVIHLEHPRGPDSNKTNPFFENNEGLWAYLQGLDPQSLLGVYQDFEYVNKRGFNVKPGRGMKA